jgi:hypothetical protein
MVCAAGEGAERRFCGHDMRVHVQVHDTERHRVEGKDRLLQEFEGVLEVGEEWLIVLEVCSQPL